MPLRPTKTSGKLGFLDMSFFTLHDSIYLKTPGSLVNVQTILAGLFTAFDDMVAHWRSIKSMPNDGIQSLAELLQLTQERLEETLVMTQLGGRRSGHFFFRATELETFRIQHQLEEKTETTFVQGRSKHGQWFVRIVSTNVKDMAAPGRLQTNIHIKKLRNILYTFSGDYMKVVQAEKEL